MAQKTPQHKVLIIAGLDPTGLAGCLRDSQVCHDLKTPHYVVTTALTVQDNQSFSSTRVTPKNQLQTTLSAINWSSVKAIKIGMLANTTTVKTLTPYLARAKKRSPRLHMVWDPVVSSSSGGQLITTRGLQQALKSLLPLSPIMTPNAVEACSLLQQPFNRSCDLKELAHAFFQKYQTPVYLKGGHLKTRSQDVFFDGKTCWHLKAKPSRKTLRGTGCTLSTALATFLSQGHSPNKAARKTKLYMNKIFTQA